MIRATGAIAIALLLLVSFALYNGVYRVKAQTRELKDLDGAIAKEAEAIRVLAVEYQQPIVMVVGLQGKEPGVKPRESKKFAVNIVEPMLDVMGIAHHLLETEADHAVIAPAIETAYRNSTPVCLMVGQPPVAS